MSLLWRHLHGVTRSVSQADYANTVLADGPIGYWRMDAVSGTTETDRTTGGHNATYVGTVALKQAGPITDGDTAVAFTSGGSGAGDTGGYATATVAAPGAAWTLEAWIKRGTDAALREIVSINAAEVLVGAGASVASYSDSGGTKITGLKTVTDSAWHHVVVTCTGSVVALYVDAGADGTFAGGNVLAATTLNIGRFYTGGFTWGGSIDEVALYNIVLTPAQIANHYAVARL